MPAYRTNSSYSRRRSTNRRSVLPYFLIVCEDEIGVVNYFRSFPYNKKGQMVKVVGNGGQHFQVVRKAEVEFDKLIKKGICITPNQVWCVIDFDDNQGGEQENFNRAFREAKIHGFNIIYSIQCFELWYLLHFNYYSSAISRRQYDSKLSDLIGKRYEHNDNLYEELLPRQNKAITYSTKLNNENKFEDPDCNVHVLVEELNMAFESVKNK